MQSICKRYTELPHTSRLFNDLLYAYDRVQQFYPHSPFELRSYRHAAAQLQYPHARREQLISVLREQNGDSETLARLAEPGTVAVLTGQQVGLFSGPAYTVYKALTAVKLAKKLTEEGLPAVPVFWLATEDHDFEEVRASWSFDAAARPHRFSLTQAATPADRPVGGIVLEHPPLDDLTRSLEGLPFGAEVAALVRQAYQPGRTLGAAFQDLVKGLLRTQGLLYFDPMHPGSRKLGVPFLKQAAEASEDLIRALLARNKQLTDAGYHAQVHIEPDSSLFFVIENGRRVSARKKSRADLIDRSDALSPNAVIRPVMQDYMFPTIAYIGGPAELAYLAQSAVAYDRLLGHMPVAVPRNGFTLIDGRGAKLMKRYDLQLESFFHGDDPLKEAIAAKLTPPELAKLMDEVTASTDLGLNRLRAGLKRFDATLAAALDKSASKIDYQMSKIRRKVNRESLRRDERAEADAAYLFHNIYPEKHLQERFYSILPFVARHGFDLIDTIEANIHVDCPDHHLLFV